MSAIAAHPSGAGAQNREALWGVVQACRLNHAVTGAAFPCLSVNVSEGVERGYVILRPPLGDEDLILAPTRKIVGIEDASIEAVDAPNYFDDAWNARAMLAARGRAAPPRDEMALAVNSSLARTQDQLHIHIGCISTEMKRSIAAIEPELLPTRWRRLTKPIAGFMFWGRRIAQDTLAGVNPFHLASEGLPIASEDRGKMTIVVAGTRSAQGRDGFVLLAAIDDRFRPGFPHSGADLLDRSCP
jgi:CDP-diacylglycerol pyrophosphatase